VAPPFRQAEFDIMYADGISKEGCLLDLGVEYKLVQKSGTWLSYGEERLGQGRENARTTLKEKTELRDNLEKAIRDKAREDGVFLVAASPKEEDGGEEISENEE